MSHISKTAKLKQYFRHHLIVFFHRFSKTQVSQQKRNFKSIPIIIINFNQLYYLKMLIGRLQSLGYLNLVIIDNNSTYKPLLNYYETIKNEIKIHRLDSNAGHLSFWKQKNLLEKYTKGYYVITDADVVPTEDCPEDFLKTMLKLLDKAYDRTKVGFSLRLEDIPDYNPQKQKIIDWEAQFWTTKIQPKVYKAEIDTTFALYRPGYTYKKKDFTKAWRTDYPLQAIHGGWYINPNDLTDEQAYYQKTANTSASWLLGRDGDLKSDSYQKIYANERN